MLTLSIEKRTVLGKGSSKLSKDTMPAVFYGHKEASTPITVSRPEFEKILREAGESSVIVLKGAGKELEALIHDVDFDPIKGHARHADFYVIEKGKKVNVKVPLHFEGTPIAVKNLGGILVKVLHEIEIEAMPKDLPHEITVSIERLDTLDSQLHAKDVQMPAGVVCLENPEEVIALVSAPKEEKEEVTGPVDLSSIEVEKKGKKEEEGEASAEAPSAK